MCSCPPHFFTWLQLCHGHKKPAKHFIYAVSLVVCLESFRIKRAEFAKLCAMKMSFGAKTGKTPAKKGEQGKLATVGFWKPEKP